MWVLPRGVRATIRVNILRSIILKSLGDCSAVCRRLSCLCAADEDVASLEVLCVVFHLIKDWVRGKHKH